jgi:hypothetical protein
MLARLLLALAFAAAIAQAARADVVEARNVAVVQADEALVVSADFLFDLSPRLEEALHNGLPLHFAAEFELVRPRWYWFDEKTASERLNLRLVYHSLSRQYRVSRGALYRNFASLAEALRALGTVREWAAVERDRLKPDEAYVAMVRLRLDTAQLPKPFQVSALTNREWTLTSEWTRVAFTANPAGAAAR